MNGKHVLITGHTGFKGSWLIAMLHSRGIKVSGISLDPALGGLFQIATLEKFLVHDLRQDIRDSVELRRAIQKVSPDIVVHLAAQPLVLHSYDYPKETYETNVIGTLNVLEAIEATHSVQATLIITTDKVYRQDPGEARAFVESDALGAADPYSTSKAMADLLTQSWIKTHPESRIAIARAGNVVGGGDIAQDRLLPDLARAFSSGSVCKVRNPKSVRPWQHVLDCLNGYLILLNEVLEGRANSGAYNFGPDSREPLSVEDVADLAARYWQGDAYWEREAVLQPTESTYLTLDSSKSKSILGWNEYLTAEQAIKLTIEFEKGLSIGIPANKLLTEQIEQYQAP